MCLFLSFNSVSFSSVTTAAFLFFGTGERVSADSWLLTGAFETHEVLLGVSTTAAGFFLQPRAGIARMVVIGSRQ